MKVILLTFDLEEFDIPQEYGIDIAEREQMSVSVLGSWALLNLLEQHGIKATFFCTAHFAQNNEELVKKIAHKHEIASHSFYHDVRKPTNSAALTESKKVLEQIVQKPVIGFRMPRLMTFTITDLATHGYLYDASINPTYLPNRYNFFFKKATPHFIGDILEIPSATVPWIRLPLFWLTFKNIPLRIYTFLCRLTLSYRKVISLYFHPWEFADLSGYPLPNYIKKESGTVLLEKLNRALIFLIKQNVQFMTCSEFRDGFLKDTTNS